MINERMRAADATLTGADLQTMTKVAYSELLGRTCDQQRQSLHDFELHSASNLGWADYYHRQFENGGHVPFLDGEEQALRFRGWDASRIVRLRTTIEVVMEGFEPIKARLINCQLRVDQEAKGHYYLWLLREAHALTPRSIRNFRRDWRTPSMPLLLRLWQGHR